MQQGPVIDLVIVLFGVCSGNDSITSIEALTFKLLNVNAEESAASKMRSIPWYILDKLTQRCPKSIDLLVQCGIIYDNISIRCWTGRVKVDRR